MYEGRLTAGVLRRTASGWEYADDATDEDLIFDGSGTLQAVETLSGRFTNQNTCASAATTRGPRTAPTRPGRSATPMRDAMRRRGRVPAAACVAACLCAPAASTAIVREPCSAPGKLVAATASAAIGITPDRTFYGCVRGHRARRLVNDDISGSAKGGVATGSPRLVNNRAGWVFEYCDRGGCEVRLEIRNLSTGQRTSARLTGFPETTAVRVLLSERGVLVLSRRTPTGGEIVKLKRGGGAVTVGSGALDPTSLAISVDRAYWVAAGQPSSAPL